MSPKALLISVSLIAGLAAAKSASAMEQLLIKADEAQMITMPAEPGTVVVGNPSIVDVTTDGKHVFVHGRVWGTSNLLILDTLGNQLASFEVTVTRAGEYNVTTYRAGRAYSYNCAPDCEMVLQIGDSYPDRFKPLSEQQQTKINIATGKTSAEAKPPGTAQ